VISTVLGTMIALALVRYDFFGRRASNYLIVVPTATPEVVLGASLLSMFLIYGLDLGFTTLLIAHVMFCISFVVIVVRSRLIGFDRSLEEAAQDLGADPITTFRKITLPLIWPGIIAGALLAFALSIDDFVVSNFTAGTEVTFPLYIFGAAQRGIPVQVYIIATMLFSITLIAMVFTVLQQRRADRLASVRPEQEV
jgi:spermidine/putrescine transport system permease protein